MIFENIALIIPALNPEETLLDYVKELIDVGAGNIIVVNDGSTEEKRYIFDKLSSFSECTVIHHEVNKGKGRALKNALDYYETVLVKKNKNVCGVITVDSDGQHKIEDVKKVAEALIEKSADGDCLILGEREFDHNVPLRSKIGNVCTRVLFQLLYRVKLTDTQTGLRGITNGLINLFKGLDGERYEYEMNMLICCSKHRIPIRSVIIQTVYLNDNQSSHFNPIKDSIKIYKLLLGNFFKYIWVSLLSFLLDISFFELLVLGLRKHFSVYYILLATIGARVGSSIVNYVLNRKMVFRSREQVKKTLFKYYLLVAVQMFASGILVGCLHRIFPCAEVVWKVLVDTVLFVVNYHVQQNFIFIK